MAVNQQLQVSLLGAQHDGLVAGAPDQIERLLRLPVQRQFQQILCHAGFEGRAQLLGNRKEPIRWAQSVQTLMRPPVIVMFHPEPNSFARLLQAVKLRALQEVFPNGLPEALDLAERLWMMRLTLEVRHAVFAQLRLEPRRAAPGGVLPAIVGEQFLRRTEFADCRPVHFQHMLGGLAPKHIQPHEIPGMIIHEPNQIRVLAVQSKREDVGLPHLVGRRALKEPRLGWIAFRFTPGRRQ